MAAVAGCALAALALPVSEASATCPSLHVTDSSDDFSTDTLRQRVTCADPGDTVIIDPGINPVLEAFGINIVISKNLTIQGQGKGATTITVTNHDDHAFVVNSPHSVTLRGLKIDNGKAPDGSDGPGGAGGDGGAIQNHGSLTLDDVSITNSDAGNGGFGAEGPNGNPPTAGTPGGAGGRGGAVFSDGTSVTITNSSFSSNTAGDGGDGGAGGNNTAAGAGAAAGVGGGGGDGGAIYIAAGPFQVSGSVFVISGDGSDAGDGGPGGTGGTGFPNGGSAIGGVGGDGGAIAFAPVVVAGAGISNTTIAQNHAGDGGEGGDGIDATSPTAGAPGALGGRGGGVFTDSGQLDISNSTIGTSNTAGDGGTGGDGGANTAAGAGAGGGIGGIGGRGGGIAVGTTELELEASTVGGASISSGNDAGDGGKGGNGGSGTGGTGAAGQGGAGGFGGGISIDSMGQVDLGNTTVVGNEGGGGGGSGTGSGTPFGGTGGGASGVFDNGTLDAVHMTMSANKTGPGAGAGVIIGGSGALNVGIGATATLKNSLIGGNAASPGGSGAQCVSLGLIVDGGHNLAFPNGAPCPPGFAGGNPLLQPLASNGGPTQTMALGAGSAAIDQIPASHAASCRVTDQRGVSRPQGPACDIGAFEAPAVVPPAPTTTGAATTAETPKKKKCKKKKKRSAGAAKKKCKKKKKK